MITRTYSKINTNGFFICRQGLRVSRIFGVYYAASTDSPAWLQFFTTTLSGASATLGQGVAPTTTVTIPVLEIQITKNTSFAELFDCAASFIPGPVYCAISSTPGVFTTAGANDAADIFIEAEEWEEQTPTLTVVTQAGASASVLQVWDNTLLAPTAAKVLYDVLVTDLGNNGGAQLYLQLFSNNFISIVADDVPIQTWAIPLNGTGGVNIPLLSTLLLTFGDSQKGGYRPMQQGGTLDSGKNTGINKSACTLYISTTPTRLTPAATTSCLITARYCTPAI